MRPPVVGGSASDVRDSGVTVESARNHCRPPQVIRHRDLRERARYRSEFLHLVRSTQTLLAIMGRKWSLAVSAAEGEGCVDEHEYHRDDSRGAAGLTPVALNSHGLASVRSLCRLGNPRPRGWSLREPSPPMALPRRACPESQESSRIPRSGAVATKNIAVLF
jgi:hypothetical protein